MTASAEQKIRERYSAENMARWKHLAGVLRVNFMLARLSEAHVTKHVERREFAVGFYMSLQNRRDLYKLVDGVCVELNDDYHAELVAGGLFRRPATLGLRPKHYYKDTVKRYVAEWDYLHGTWMKSEQGCHAKTAWLLEDPTLKQRFEAYVDAEGELKGKPNLKAEKLTKWVNDVLFRVGHADALITKGVTERCVQNWLHRCGYGYEAHRKAGLFARAPAPWRCT